MVTPKLPSPPRLYFAYGSNLSLLQMASRCPTSTYHSFGVLRGYRWIIGDRGYANVVKTKDEHVVYGMLYTLEPEDETLLDRAEGVPHAYFKRELDVELISKDSDEGKGSTGSTSLIDAKGEVVKVLVYVDEKRLGEGICKEEYVARINRGIKDAMEKGMERTYVEKVVRPFVREEEVGGVVVDPFHPEMGELSEDYAGLRDDI
jgi:gamma-glutamylcyclotransferase